MQVDSQGLQPDPQSLYPPDGNGQGITANEMKLGGQGNPLSTELKVPFGPEPGAPPPGEGNNTQAGFANQMMQMLMSFTQFMLQLVQQMMGMGKGSAQGGLPGGLPGENLPALGADPQLGLGPQEGTVTPPIDGKEPTPGA